MKSHVTKSEKYWRNAMDPTAHSKVPRTSKVEWCHCSSIPFILVLSKIVLLTITQIIPSLGIESTPPDILTWSLVKTIREQLSTGTKEAISCVHEVKYDRFCKPCTNCRSNMSAIGAPALAVALLLQSSPPSRQPASRISSSRRTPSH